MRFLRLRVIADSILGAHRPDYPRLRHRVPRARGRARPIAPRVRAAPAVR